MAQTMNKFPSFIHTQFFFKSRDALLSLLSELTVDSFYLNNFSAALHHSSIVLAVLFMVGYFNFFYDEIVTARNIEHREHVYY